MSWKKSLLIWLALSPILFLSILPFVVMFLSSVKPLTEIYESAWWPTRFAWENFVVMWTETGFAQALWNSLYISTLATVIAIVAAIPAAYALSRFRIPGKSLIEKFLLVSQMLSPIVLVLGLFKVMVLLGVLDRIETVAVLYAGFNIAFSIWMLQSYFSTIPKDLEESAWIEGAQPFVSLRRVFLPLALPAIAVAAMFTFVNSWNEFVIALTMLRDQDNYTLPIEVLSMTANLYRVDWHLVMAAALVATLPIAVVLAWMQKYLLQGTLTGAVR